MLVIKGTKQKKVHPHFNIKIEYMIGRGDGHEESYTEVDDDEYNRKGIEWFLKLYEKVVCPEGQSAWHWDDLTTQYANANLSKDEASWLVYSITPFNSFDSNLREDKLEEANKLKDEFEKSQYGEEHPLLDVTDLYKEFETDYSWRTVENVDVIYIDDRGIKHDVEYKEDKKSK